MTTLHRWTLAAVMAAALGILLLTLTPLGAGPANTLGDICALGLPCWLGHAVVFLILGLALGAWFATSDAARRAPKRTLVMVLLALWIFAAADELAQQYVGRNAQLEDWLIDMAAGICGMLGGSFLLRHALRWARR